MPKVVGSIEARMGSSRLPGKVLYDIGGQPALTRLLRRLRRCTRLDSIVLATTVSPADDRLVEWATAEGIPVHRGSEADVLQRVVDAHRAVESEVVVEITGDCVLLDPDVIDWGIETFLENECDVVTNTRRPSFPTGADVQVFRLADLEHVAASVDDPAVREHVSLYFYEHPEQYRSIHLIAPRQWRAPEMRLQLDYPEDYRFICDVYRQLEPAYGDAFGMPEILALVHAQPNLLELNRHCRERALR